MKSRIAIVAALPREVAPLVRDWRGHTASSHDAAWMWECDRAIAVCAGMGRERVTRALRLAMSRGPVAEVISAGYSGGLRVAMQVDTAYWPATVIDDETGERFNCTGGSGTLVSTNHAVGRDEKTRLAARWNADLVDMEAATVARLAQLQRLPFRAVRAISDRADDNLPDFGRFIDEGGGFRERAFAFYVALHPWMVPMAIRLGKQSAQASHSIARALREVLEQAE